ncbi:hypothetical protein [Rhodococcus aetherivorans]
MPYTPLTPDPNGVYAQNDFAAAQANYRHATWTVQDIRHRIDAGHRLDTELDAALVTYREARERLLAVRPFVKVAGGHPHLPESV